MSSQDRAGIARSAHWRENRQLGGPDIFLSYNREDQAVAQLALANPQVIA
jgi:hypothetical protein